MEVTERIANMILSTDVEFNELAKIIIAPHCEYTTTAFANRHAPANVWTITFPQGISVDAKFKFLQLEFRKMQVLKEMCNSYNIRHGSGDH